MNALPESPYKGLAAFEDSELDALLFFGREREIEAVATNVLASRLTVLYGPSGVGKSSLLRAGVARRLRELGTAPVVVHSSWVEDPAGALAASVRAECGELGPTAGLVDTVAAAAQQAGEVHLLLDQFEEYVLYHGSDGPLSAALPELLRRPGLRVNVLIAIRDDALAELDEFTGRIPELFANLLRLDRLDRTEGRAAILGPLARYGELTGEEFTAEDALVEVLLDEVAEGRLDAPGAPPTAGRTTRIEAPYLQLVLERLWEREQRDGSHKLRLETLRAVGGSRAVVREHVQGVLAQLSVPEQEVAARVVRQLVTPSGRKVSHEAGDLAEYADVEPAQLRDLLEHLGRRRIVRAVNGTPGAPTRYEIFHDVLGPPILTWQRERQLEEEREQAARQRRRLRAIAAVSFAGFVLVALLAAFALLQRSHAQTQARRARARALTALALADLATNPQKSVSLALRAVQLSANPQATSVLRTSLAAMREEHVFRLGGSIVAASFAPRTGALLIASSDGRLDTYVHGHLYPVVRHGPALTSAAWSSDGQRFVAGSVDGIVRLWGPRFPGGSVLLRTHSAVTSVEYQRDTLLVASGADVLLDDDLTGKVKRLRFRGKVEAAALDPNTEALAVAFLHGKHTIAELIDARSGRVIRVLRDSGIHSFAFSPNGEILASGSYDFGARLWSTRTGRLLHTLAHKGYVVHESFSADGSQLVTSSSDGGAYVWNVATGQRQLLLVGATGGIESAAFSPDGSEIVTGSADRLARIYYASDGRLLAPLGGAANAVTSVAFDASGRSVVTASSDGTARVWDAQPPGTLTTIDTRRSTVHTLWLAGHPVSVGGNVARILTTSGSLVRSVRAPSPIVAAASGGNTLALVDSAGDVVIDHTGSAPSGTPGAATAVAVSAGGDAFVGFRDGSVGCNGCARRGAMSSLIDAPLGTPVLGLSTAADRLLVRTASVVRVYTTRGALVSTIHAATDHATLSPDGLQVATSKGSVALLWDATTGRLLHTLRGHTKPITDVEYSPGGRSVITVSDDHTGLLWSAPRGSLVHRLIGHFFPIYAAGFSPDGNWIVTASQFTAGLWKTATGQLMFYVGRHAAPLTSVAFGPTGDWILTGSQDGTARVYRCQVCASLGRLERLAELRLRRLGG